MKPLTLAALAVSLVAGHGAAPAQDAGWPQQRPIRMLVGQPAGYSPDVVSRALAEQLSRHLKQTIVVENRPGGGGALMMRALRASPADGYTIGSVFWNQMAVAPSLIRQIDYDPAEDFAHLGIWMSGAQILVAHPGSGIDSVARMIERARAAKPALPYASMGTSAPSHVFTELLVEQSKIALRHVPFRGAEAVLAAVNGEVPLAMLGVSDALPMIRERKLLPLAVTGEQRVPALPSVPTFAESGVPGMTHAVWAGLIAPKGTPAAVVARLNEAMTAVSADPAFRERFEQFGRTLRVGTPEQMLRTVREEIPLWRGVIERAGIKAD